MQKTSFLIVFFLTASLNCFAQLKYEKESRLKVDQVPKNALQFVESLEPTKKVKWYFEENLSGNSIEAKFDKNEFMYSVEFDSLGNLEDIEILKPWEAIDVHTRNAIETYLKKQFNKYKIRKVQFQLTGKPKDLAQVVKANLYYSDIPYTLKYELIVKGNKNKDISLYELLFDDEGENLKLSKILLRNTDNLEY